MNDKIQGTGKEFIISLMRQYLPNAVLVDEQIKDDVIRIEVGIFYFEIEIYASRVLLYKGFIISSDSVHTLKRTSLDSFEVACQDIKDFLVEQQTAIATTLGERKEDL